MRTIAEASAMVAARKERERVAREERETVDARYAAALPGWVSLKDVRLPCVCEIVGKRPRNGCPCRDMHCASGILDHYRWWRLPDGARAITGAPYSLRDLQAFQVHCAALGACVRVVEGESPYGHGSHFVIVTKKEAVAAEPTTSTRSATMPKTQIFKHGEDVSVITSASDERDFIETFTEALKPVMKNGNGQREQEKAVAAGFDIIAKMRGYKSEVQERRILAAGRWPHPSETPVSSAGADAEAEG